MWRVEGDIQDWWASINDRIDYMAKNVNQLKQTTGPGGWPDFDMVNIFFIVSTINRVFFPPKSYFHYLVGEKNNSKIIRL